MATNNYGLVREGMGKAVPKQLPLPKPRSDELLVRTVAIALNPTDWTTLEAPGDNGTLVGVDYAGIVEEVGKDVTRKFKKGDRIAGFAHGANDLRPETGAFARFIVVKGDLQYHVPDNVSLEDACEVGCGTLTLTLAMHLILGLSLPGAPPSDQTILIYGGSTATGSLAIQFAKLSGARVITTASPKNFEMLKSLGADEVLDYRNPDVGKQIRIATGNSLSLVFDCVSTEQTAAICAEAIGSKGGQYCSLLGPDCPRSDVKSTFFLAYSACGEEYIYEGVRWPVVPGVYEHAVKLAPIVEKLWTEGKFKPHPQRLEAGGLTGALEGMKIMKAGRYSTEKLVYRVDDTQWPEE